LLLDLSVRIAAAGPLELIFVAAAGSLKLSFLAAAGPNFIISESVRESLRLFCSAENFSSGSSSSSIVSANICFSVF